MIVVIVIILGLCFWLSFTATPDYSKYWEEKGRKEFMKDIHAPR